MQDLTVIRQELITIVTLAGEHLTQFRKKGFTTHSKGGVDFATEADDFIDAFLKKSLSEKFPDTTFLTEETAPSDFSQYIEKENLWVIDPIDGTVNFSRGSDHCAISVALVDKGKTKLGVVYLPFEQKLYWAQQDSDEAFCNDFSLKVSDVAILQQALVCCDWSWDIEKRKKTLHMLEKVLPYVRAIQCRGSAAAEISSIAAGEVDAYFINGLKPWDCAAGILIAEKAGASIQSLDGKEWSVFSSDFLITNGKLDTELAGFFS